MDEQVAGQTPERGAGIAVGILGGTGPQGRGLGLRLALAGHRILVGSRDAARAAQAAAELREAAGRDVDIDGAGNAEVCVSADVVLVTVPYEAQRATLPPLADALAGKVVVCCVNALAVDELGPRPVRVEAGSAAEECAQLLPGARVASAFQNVSARRLARIGEPVTVDVLVCSDDEDAAAAAMALADRIDGMRSVRAGALRLSQPVEDLTAVLVGINRRYKTHAGIRIDGV
jgi:8-hydroxy-5-deazaflavin:NADPH oxidoreductase